MKLYLTRHGQTEWNIKGKYQGWLDSPLTEKGVYAAYQLGKRIQNVDFDAVYSSDLGRAKATTKAMGYESKAVYDQRLREIDLGVWSGMAYDEAPKQTPELYRRYFYDPLNYRPDIGENHDDFYQRVKDFIDMLDKKHAHDTVLLVCHGVTMIMLQIVLNGQGIADKVNYSVPGGTHLFIADRQLSNTSWVLLNDGSHIE